MSMLRRGILAIPHGGCNSCLGKWDDSVVQTIQGATVFPKVSGSCNHQLSTDGEQSGIFIESAPNSVTIDWDSDEIRWWGVHLKDKKTMPAPGGGTIHALIVPFAGSGVDGLGSYIKEQNNVFTWIASNVQNQKSYLSESISSNPDKLYCGVDGDKNLYFSDGNKIIKSAESLTSSSFTALAQFNATLYSQLGTVPEVKGDVLTDSDNIDIPSTALNITNKTICGDLISKNTNTPTCSYALTNTGNHPVTISGANNQTVKAVYDGSHPSGYEAASFFDEFSAGGWSDTEVRIIQISVLSRSNGTGSTVKLVGSDNGNQLWIASRFHGTDTKIQTTNVGDFAKKGYGTHTETISNEKIDNFALGISGDGKIWVITDSNYYKPVKDSEQQQIDADNFGFRELRVASDFIAGHDDDIESKIISKASNITLTMPDMSSEGITKITDFCGNEVT